ncbi:phosphosulfolactate synthase [Paenibacillus daejeonensis]|uniref:phosphosulfolactate synthase n=1 Tax=Paenibacillus daejeonensis TaxID=135193 RepID=UPI00037E0713|nr:phosphosulfolactate synthase [Paenibacillus daejeonensis]
MEAISRTGWHPLLCDPIGERESRRETGRAAATVESTCGLTMVIDKGLGWHAFCDLLETSGHYIDCIKLGFGTSALYAEELLESKIRLARRYEIRIMPGGTLLETAVRQDVADSFLDRVCKCGYDTIEVSDGTIELSRARRSELIRDGVKRGLHVYTEYGKKEQGFRIDLEALAATAEADWAAGAELVSIEARESGVGVGLFDEAGRCSEDELEQIRRRFPDLSRFLWEAPQKDQQLTLLRAMGCNVNLGNIQPTDVLTLEAMRRGLRSDTFPLPAEVPVMEVYDYMI